jgi:hypothetical protein
VLRRRRPPPRASAALSHCPKTRTTRRSSLQKRPTPSARQRPLAPHGGRCSVAADARGEACPLPAPRPPSAATTATASPESWVRYSEPSLPFLSLKVLPHHGAKAPSETPR